MALPGTITQSKFPPQNYHLGPFEYNGNLYTVVLYSLAAGRTALARSQDGGESWSSISSANTGTDEIASMWVTQDGALLHVAVQVTGATRNVYYHSYDLSTGTSSAVRTVASIASGTHSACSIAKRSNGELVIVAQGPANRIMGTDYSTIYLYKSTDNGTSWSSGVSLAAATESNRTASSIVVGANDLIHVFFNRGSVLTHVSVTSAGSIGTPQTVRSNVNWTYPVSEAVYDSLNDEVYVSFVFGDALGNPVVGGAYFPSVISPTISVYDNLAGNATVNNSSYVGSLGRDGDVYYVMYSNLSDSDLFYDESTTATGWGADTAVLTGITANHLSTKALSSGIGYVYDDGGTVKYNNTNQPPSVPVITNPADTATVDGAVSLEATVSDPDGDNVYAVWELWEEAAVQAGSVLDSFSSPSTNPVGLTHDGTNIWNADSGTGLIYKLNPADGTVLDSFAAPGTSPEGLSHDGTNLWCSDSATDLIYKLNPVDGAVLDSFAAPDSNPAGLSHDGTNLWCAGDASDTIYKLNPADGTVLDSFASPDLLPTGLSHDGVHLWCAGTFDDLIYRLDPTDGAVLESFAAPGGIPTGLSHDGVNLWNADNGTDTIYKLSPGDTFVSDITENTTPVTSGSTHTTSWDTSGLAGGTYLLRAWSVDSKGLQSSTYDEHTVTVSAGEVVNGVQVGLSDTAGAGTSTVAVNNPPNTPTILSPSPDTTVASPVSIEISYSDPDGDTQARVSIRREVTV